MKRSPYVALAGHYSNGSTPDWRAEVTAHLEPLKGTILDPRPERNSYWNPTMGSDEFKEQFTWELNALDRADVTAFYFLPGSKSPITLLQLGLFVRRSLIVCCPKGFQNRGHVDHIVERYGLTRVEDLNELKEAIAARLGLM